MFWFKALALLVFIVCVSGTQNLLSLDKVHTLSFVNVSGVSAECQRDHEVLMEQFHLPASLLNGDGFWALKAFDSYGKVPNDGELSGNFFHMGSYSSCLEVEAKTGLAKALPFRGKYCNLLAIPGGEVDQLGLVTPLLPPFDQFFNNPSSGAYLTTIPRRLGMCVPSTCSLQDVNLALQDQGQALAKAGVSFAAVNCVAQDEALNLSTGDIVMIAILSIFGLLILCGTLYEILNGMENNDKGSLQLLAGFSLPSNLKKLLAVDTFNGHVACLDGLRVISMCWVLIGHTYGTLGLFQPVNNYFQLPQLISGFLFRGVLNGAPSVDTFFFLSGFLVSFLTLKELDRSDGKLNVFIYYLHRYIRLTAVYALIIGFHATLYKYLSIGPGAFMRSESEFCAKSWWWNLLYVNNLPVEDTYFCLGQTWYLAADMQMFLVSPLMIVPLWHLHNKKGKTWTVIFSLSWVLVFTVLLLVLCIVKHWPLSSLVDLEGTDYMQWNYEVPWTRAQPYIIGIICGFILKETRNQRIKLKTTLVVATWCLAFASGLAICYGVDPASTLAIPPIGYSRLENVLYGTFYRLAWGLCLAWIVLACYHGYGGWINQFLSWEAFRPLSRLCYVMFLLHQTVINVLGAQIPFNFQATHAFETIFILAVFLATVIVSAAVVVTLEMPLLQTEKWLFSSLLKSKRQKLK